MPEPGAQPLGDDPRRYIREGPGGSVREGSLEAKVRATLSELRRAKSHIRDVGSGNDRLQIKHVIDRPF